MGYFGFPRIDMYWKPMYHIPLVANNMNLNRFYNLRNNLHFVNNLEGKKGECRTSNKVWKVSPILNKVKE